MDLAANLQRIQKIKEHVELDINMQSAKSILWETLQGKWAWVQHINCKEKMYKITL